MAEAGWPRALVATAAWRVSYADPIRLLAGDTVALSGCDDFSDGHRWLWAEAADGRAGWVPDTLVADGQALSDYCAVELGCAPGDRLTGFRATHGWVWCRDAAGAEGWVPDRTLRPAR